jgi:hypothetical protein
MTEKEEVKMRNLYCVTKKIVDSLTADVNTSTNDRDEDMDGVEPSHNSDWKGTLCHSMLLFYFCQT